MLKLCMFNTFFVNFHLSGIILFSSMNFGRLQLIRWGFYAENPAYTSRKKVFFLFCFLCHTPRCSGASSFFCTQVSLLVALAGAYRMLGFEPGKHPTHCDIAPAPSRQKFKRRALGVCLSMSTVISELNWWPLFSFGNSNGEVKSFYG